MLWLRFALFGSAMAMSMTIAACSAVTVGEPGATGSPAPSPEAPNSSTSHAALPVNQPCSLLSAGALKQIGVSSPPSPDRLGTAHSCDVDSASYHIGLDIRTDVGLAGFRGVSSGGGITDHVIGRHKAKEQTDNAAASCTVAVGVSESSRVDVTATGDGTDDPCPIAMTVAELVERRLP